MGERFWPLRDWQREAMSRAAEVFEFTWSMDSGDVAEGRGISADRVWIDEARFFVNEMKGGKMATLKTTKVNYAKQYLASANLTPDELLAAVRDILNDHNVPAEITRHTPKWRAGDVVTVKFDAFGMAYTYVRGRTDWPGDGMRLSDTEMNTRYLAGSVKPILQQGGVPFDDARKRPA